MLDMMREAMTVANVQHSSMIVIQRQGRKGRFSAFYAEMGAALLLFFGQAEQLAREPFREGPTAFVLLCLFFSQDLAPALIEKSCCLFLSMIGNKSSFLGMGFWKTVELYKSRRMKIMLSSRRIRISHSCLAELNFGVHL